MKIFGSKGTFCDQLILSESKYRRNYGASVFLSRYQLIVPIAPMSFTDFGEFLLDDVQFQCGRHLSSMFF